MKKVRKLYEKCWVCDGSGKTRIAFNEGRKNERPAGSPCFACETGFVETGLTMGQVEDSLTKQLAAMNRREFALSDLGHHHDTDYADREQLDLMRYES